MKCPSCESGNIKTVQMIYMSGTRNGKTKMKGIGLSARGLSVGVGGGNTSSQSLLAESCAPPKTSGLPKLVVFLLVFSVWIPLFALFMSSLSAPSFLKGVGTFLLAGGLLGVTTYGLVKLYKKLNLHNLETQHRYGNSWVCLKCGTKFLPSGFSSLEQQRLESEQITKALTEQVDAIVKEQSKTKLVSDSAFTYTNSSNSNQIPENLFKECPKCNNEISSIAKRCGYCDEVL